MFMQFDVVGVFMRWLISSAVKKIQGLEYDTGDEGDGEEIPDSA